MPAGRAAALTLRFSTRVGRLARRDLFSVVSPLLFFDLIWAFWAGVADGAGATGAVASKRRCSSGVNNIM
jgi:hypothetical protein